VKTELDTPDDLLDDRERAFLDKVRKFGWAATTVEDDDEGPGFAYSTGFWLRHGRPEVFTFLPGQAGHQVLWNIERMLAESGWLPVDRLIMDVLEGYPVVLRPMAKSYYPDFIGWTRWFYGALDAPCLQLFWPDRQGRFPWELPPDDSFHLTQPDLTARSPG